MFLLATPFRPSQFDFKGRVMEPAPPAPSSQRGRLRMSAPPACSFLLRTGRISAASYCTYTQTVAEHTSAKPGRSTRISVNLVRADFTASCWVKKCKTGLSRITLGFSLWDAFPLSMKQGPACLFLCFETTQNDHGYKTNMTTNNVFTDL